MAYDDDLITDPALQSLLQSAAQTRQQSLAVLDLLAQPLVPSTASAEESILGAQLVLSKQLKLLRAHLAQLRRQNHQAIRRARGTKQETAEARQEIDSLHLHLQNLYYEQRHLRGEIAGCENHEHRYKHLPMIDPEEYVAQHPEHSESSEHDLTVARIQNEHTARLALEAQRLQLVKRKEALAKETAAKRDELAKLDGELETWLGGQEGLRKVFEAREKKMAAPK